MGLIQPAWMGTNVEEAVQALRTAKKSTWRKAALKAPLPEIRVSAAVACDSTGLYMKMAKNDKEPGVRAAMIEQVYREKDLRSLLKSEQHPGVRKRISEKLLDMEKKQAEILRQAKEREKENRRNKEEHAERIKRDKRFRKAFEKLKEEELVRLFCEKDSDMLFGEPYEGEKFIKRQYISLLKEQSSFLTVALEAQEWMLREEAAEFLTDPEMLIQLIRATKDPKTRDKLIKKVHHQEMLTELILSGDLNAQNTGTAICSLTDKQLLSKLLEADILANTVDIRLQELESQELCPDEHDWETVEEEYDSSDDDFRIEYTTVRCKRCGIMRKSEYWSNRYFELKDPYFVSRLPGKKESSKQTAAPDARESREEETVE